MDQDASVACNRCSPAVTSSTKACSVASSGVQWVVHSTNCVIWAARSRESLALARPDWMIGMSADAARKRFSCGVGSGVFDIADH